MSGVGDGVIGGNAVIELAILNSKYSEVGCGGFGVECAALFVVELRLLCR